MSDTISTVELFRRQSLRANVARACPNCGAPGHWHDIEGVNPGCYDPAKVMEARARHEGFAPVGSKCPQCGSARPDVEELGEIWSHEIRAPTTWDRVKNAVVKVIGG